MANPVLSARGVESRIQRILKKLQKVALQGVSRPAENTKTAGVEESKGRTKFSQSARIFSLRSFSEFLPIVLGEGHSRETSTASGARLENAGAEKETTARPGDQRLPKNHHSGARHGDSRHGSAGLQERAGAGS